MSKETLQARLKENYEMQSALPGRFSLGSGKQFTYRIGERFGSGTLHIERVYREGEEFDSPGSLVITQDGVIQYFTFHSFSGENAIDLNEARIYIRDCAELLSPDFLAKIAADYQSKIDAFAVLEKQEKEIRAAISEIEKHGVEG
jgi:hypothetical protein